MITPYWDRTDYVAAMGGTLCYVLTVEKLMQVEVPERAQYIRVILAELNRLCSHLLWLGTHAIDIGAVTVFSTVSASGNRSSRSSRTWLGRGSPATPSGSVEWSGMFIPSLVMSSESFWMSFRNVSANTSSC